jgi:hypothetical protein
MTLVAEADGQDVAVTVVTVPRDHYADAVESLDSILERTDIPFRLVYVLGKAPLAVRDEVRRRCTDLGFLLLEHDGYPVPGHARNEGVARVRTPFVAFVDNDAVVAPGWLGSMLRCLEETGGDQVGPLQLIGPLEDEAVHVAGGFIEIDDTTTPRRFKAIQRHQRHYVAEVADQLRREQCDFAEFHCTLMRRSVFEKTGPLDEALLSSREVEDLGMAVREAGGTIWFEPDARVTYFPATRVGWRDAQLLSRRWGERANRQSFEHFFTKHGFDRRDMTALGHANCQRRPIFGSLRAVAAKPGVPLIEKLVMKPFYVVERGLNWLFVRPGRTSF